MAYSKRRINAAAKYTKKAKRSYKRAKTSRRRSAPRRRKSFRRAVLDVSTRKKQDTMIGFSGLIKNNPVYQPGYTVVPSTNGGEAYIWVATARDNTANSAAGQSNVNDIATRSATSIYLRGLKERIELKTLDSNPWRWRRIVFFIKDQSLLLNNGTRLEPYLETNEGFARLMGRISNTGDNETDLYQVRLNQAVFKGSQNIDWDNIMLAKTDPEKIMVRSDRMMTIKSGNDAGVFRSMNKWYGVNKTLIYNDEEQGGSLGSSFYSVDTSKSVGDMYVMDLFEPLVTDSDPLRLWTQSTLYWHER